MEREAEGSELGGALPIRRGLEVETSRRVEVLHASAVVHIEIA